MKRVDRAKLIVLAAFATAIAVGCTWALPGPDVWAADSISPRSCGLGAIVETYTPGHYHHYPPLHMALLTVISLPWMALAAARVGTNVDALGAELMKPFYMTGIEAGARLVAAAMALGIVWNVMRLFTRIGGGSRVVGIAAGAVVATNETFVYYAHTGNLEVPYLFWITLGLVELDRVADGEPREVPTLLCAIASALTKDQAAGAWFLPLPLLLLVVPWLRERASPFRKPMLRAVAASIIGYALVSGLAVNPSGFRTRIRVEVLGQGTAWEAYPRGLAGNLALARDALLSAPRFTSWIIAGAAVAGVVIAVRRVRKTDRLRVLSPVIAALSFTLAFNLGARRTDERFLLPQAILCLPYAAFAFDAVLARWGSKGARPRNVVFAAAAIALAPAIVGVASVDATLLADPREQARPILEGLPAGTRVDVFGGVLFLPRIPPHVDASRPGVHPLDERQLTPNVKDVVDGDPQARAPDVVVMSTEFSTVESTEPRPPTALAHYRDAATVAWFRALHDGTAGYTKMTIACALPWPLACRQIHHSTGGEVWIYERRDLAKPKL